MAWTTLSLLVLVLHCTGSLSQAVLTQSPSTSASLGALAKLTCTLSREHNNYNIGWYRQQPGKALRYVMYLYSNGRHKGDRIPDHFSGLSSEADHYLTPFNLQPEDEADYFYVLPYSGS
ncbi:Immunoglobulin omega chain [Tupaia chinensis]|nr:Immunoglobulin omega chain [Tupaia chinensis]